MFSELRECFLMTTAESVLPLLSLPIEIKNREFLGKLLLAAKAVEGGWAVIIGKQSRVCEVLTGVPPAVHLEISIPQSKLNTRIRPLVQAGHRLGCLCEEGVVYPDGRDYCLRKVGEGPLALLSFYFANGERQADDLRQYGTSQGYRLVVSGNPRFDLLHPPCRALYDDSVARIQARIGEPFVLVNTNFSLVNPHPSYGDPLQKLKQSGKLMTAEQDLLWQRVVAGKQRLIADYRRLVLALTAAGQTVVIRPHPSENVDSWLAFAAGRPRLHVVHEDSANAWMLAARAVIHTGCTTGVEAFLLQRPVIAYLPEGQHEEEGFATQLSLTAASPEQVLERLEALSSGAPIGDDPAAAARRQLAHHHIANSERPGACERILEAFAADPPSPQSLTEVRLRLRAQRRPLLRRLGSRLARELVTVLPGGLGSAALQRRQAHHHLHRQKFPGLNRGELLSVLTRFRALGVVAALPRVERIDTDLFLLSPPGVHD
ncbi:MAG: surface carbohydrate biosynthesis protein [Synechococcaceae cyanobacterium]|nr:surface carbohydrate biosynthesis protein [Synechococcaceae cyanobacterium]